jgi:hypothetical protein
MPPTPKPDWTAADGLAIRERALDELENPSGAYDGPINQAGHQFDHLFQDGADDMRTDNRRARDQSFERNGNNNGNRRNDLDPRGSDQENNGPPDAETCAQFIQTLLSGLSASDAENETDEHNKLMEYMGEIIAAHHNANGNGDQYSAPPPAPPPQAPSYSRALDRRRGTRNGRAHDRNSIALDSAVSSLNAQGFARRWPQTADIRLTGNGR